MTIGQELARKRPAIIINGEVAEEVEKYKRPRTPADWPAWVWAPLLLAAGGVPTFVLIRLAIFLVHAL